MTNEKALTVKDLPLDDKGEIVARTTGELVMKCDSLIKSGFLPERYETAGQVIVAQSYARELGLQSMTALRQIAVINGTPSIFGDLPLAIVRQSGKLKNIKEFLFDVDGKKICWENQNLSADVEGAVCITEREDGSIRETFFTIKEARAAGIFKRVWLTYPKVMLKSRARGENLKDGFSDVLNGICMGEYDFNIMNPEDTPIKYDSQNTEVTESDTMARLKDIDVETITVEAEVVQEAHMSEPVVVNTPTEPLPLTEEEQAEVAADKAMEKEMNGEAPTDDSTVVTNNIQASFTQEKPKADFQPQQEFEKLKSFVIVVGKNAGKTLKQVELKTLGNMLIALGPKIKDMKEFGKVDQRLLDLQQNVQRYIELYELAKEAGYVS